MSHQFRILPSIQQKNNIRFPIVPSRLPALSARMCDLYIYIYICVQKVFRMALTFCSKGVFDPLITMVLSVFRQNVSFGRYKHFCTKITMLPNTMKIESWVPQAMDNPMPPTFGRMDALRESSVEITKSPIPPNTMKIESWVPQAMDNPMPPKFGRIDALQKNNIRFPFVLSRLPALSHACATYKIIVVCVYVCPKSFSDGSHFLLKGGF